MPKMNKNQLVKELSRKAYVREHGIEPAKLKKMKVSALRELHQNTKLSDESKDTSTVTKEDKMTKDQFVSLCGAPFDPSKSGTCYRTCQNDSPEEFKKCEAHFKSLPVQDKKNAKSVGKKPKREVDRWGKKWGDQGWILDRFLLEGYEVSPKGAGEAIGVSASRVTRHYTHLMTEKGEDALFKTPDGNFFLDVFDSSDACDEYGCI